MRGAAQADGAAEWRRRVSLEAALCLLPQKPGSCVPFELTRPHMNSYLNWNLAVTAEELPKRSGAGEAQGSGGVAGGESGRGTWGRSYGSVLSTFRPVALRHKCQLICNSQVSGNQRGLIRKVKG